MLLHTGVAKAPLCNLVAASSFSTSVAVRCLRSVIVLSNVGGEKHPATPGTAQGRGLHIRQYETNCLVKLRDICLCLA